MSLAIVHSRAHLGIQAPAVTVETHLSNGLPCFQIVGLPETAVKESKDRVRSAIINSHFEFPSRRITVNLAPADLPKEGGRYDLPIALGILAASGQIPAEALRHSEFIGELALTGQLRGVSASLPAAMASAAQQRQLVVPASNADEAALCADADIISADNLLSLSAHLHQRERIAPHPVTSQDDPVGAGELDMADIKGQPLARRALEIAAAGSHNILFYGPPGTGKTMLASRLPGILPPLTNAELLEVASLHSLSRQDQIRLHRQRPFRNPHHTASAVALVGGGSYPRPGEISLAHRGVLFLDELPEFPRKVLEVLREPMESGEICISRASHQLQFPSRFQFVAAMNPCPCGYAGDLQRACRCTPDQIKRYRDKISGPLLDRIDLQVAVSRLPSDLLTAPSTAGEPSAAIRQRVIDARALQQHRQGQTNAELSGDGLLQHCRLCASDREFIEAAINEFQLSPRAYHRLLKVARTLADLAGRERIQRRDLQEAIHYRKMDRAH